MRSVSSSQPFFCCVSSSQVFCSLKTDSLCTAIFKAVVIAVPIGIGCGVGLFFLSQSLIYAVVGGVATPIIFGGIIVKLIYQAPKSLISQSELDKPVVVFSNEAKYPSQSYPIDEAIAKEYLKCFTDEDEKRVMTKAIDNIQHITFEMFQKALKECSERLNVCLAEKKYAVGVSPEKSNEWVYNLVKENLEGEPMVFPLSNSDSFLVGINFIEQKLKTDLSSVDESTIVLFDDCAYSGSQMKVHLNNISTHFENKKTTVDAYVVIPFMTQRAKKLFEEQHSHLNVTVITSEYQIKSLDEIFSTEEFEVLNGNRKIEMSPMGCFHGHVQHYKTLCYSDWRYPDGQSFLHPLGRASVDVEIDKDVYKSKKYCFIPKIPRVYGNKLQDFS